MPRGGMVILKSPSHQASIRFLHAVIFETRKPLILGAHGRLTSLSSMIPQKSRGFTKNPHQRAQYNIWGSMDSKLRNEI